MAISAAVTVVSGALQYRQQRAQGKYQKGVAEYNARVAENEAQDTINAGVEKENAHRRKVAQLLSSQRAQIGASGLDIDSGSPLQLQQDALVLGEADALRIRSNYEGQAQALKTSATLTRSQGEAANAFAKTAATNTLLTTGAKVIGTGVADKWLQPDSAAVQTTTPSSTQFNLDLNDSFDTSSLNLSY